MSDSYYNEKYFKLQNAVGKLSAMTNKYLSPYISKEYNVIDFGSGGGHYLAMINCKDKIGVEINETARQFSNSLGIKTVDSPSLLQDSWADVITSFHALEHCHNPLSVLQSLKPKLKKGGKFILVVPYEKKLRYKPNDINQHLFTWSEMNLGNLFTTAGFKVEKVEEIKYRYPHPFQHVMLAVSGEKLFHLISRVYGALRSNISQVRIVATNV